MKLPQRIQERLLTAIERLEADPRPRGTVKLSGFENFYRIRVGEYRAIYEIRDEVFVVLVVKVGKRGDIYD